MMNFYNYIQETNTTWVSQGSTRDRIHIQLGIFSEFGEFCGELKKELQYNSEMNKENVLLELGDLCYYLARWSIEYMRTEDVRGWLFNISPWYESIYTPVFQLEKALDNINIITCVQLIASILSSLGFTLEECLTKNIIKLSEKHPEKYTQSMLNILKQQA